MKLPIQIVFRDFPHSDAVDAAIRKRAEKLDRFFDGNIACRVAVEEPHRSHNKGNHFRVRVELSVPGEELVVARDSGEHPAVHDVFVAIRECFNTMERLLKEYVRKHRVRVHLKPREAAAHARVSKILHDGAGGYGFLQTEDGREIYFHHNSVLNGRFAQLRVGDEVRYVEEMGEEGAQASTVDVVGRDSGNFLFGRAG